MTFVSAEFFIFLAIVLPVYYLLSHRGQNIFLLLASCFFYGWWDWRFLGLLVATSGLDFIYGRILDKHHNPELPQHTRKIIVALSIIGNLTVLGFFKYYNFFVSSFLRACSHMNLHPSIHILNVILPIGISFYTFHEMSYTIDIYRGEFRSTGNFVNYMLYVCFFPHLVAGPIQRAANLLPQIEAARRPSLDKFYSGTQLALTGFFKKMVIADNLALMVDKNFTAVHPSGTAILLSIYAFAFQIYCDFSGYTDIARGVARMLSIEIPLNFRLPYFASNPREFWQRWHISLSTWLRDYLYIPLGGSHEGRSKMYRNLLLTMLLGGLWHGASWHYVVWGAYHGLLLCLYHWWSHRAALVYPDARKPQSTSWLAVFIFFQVTVMGWLIFRVDNISQLRYFLAIMLTDFHPSRLLGPTLAKIVILCTPLVVLEFYEFKTNDLEPWRHWGSLPRAAFYLVLLYSIAVLGSPAATPFIYFQF